MYRYILAILLLCTPLSAQEHNHGEDGIPDWYDSDCCNRKDCHPVPDTQIDFDIDELGNPVVVHRYDPNSLPIIYERTQWRQSKDDRYHACYYRSEKGDITRYCVYLRAGM